MLLQNIGSIFYSEDSNDHNHGGENFKPYIPPRGLWLREWSVLQLVLKTQCKPMQINSRLSIVSKEQCYWNNNL
jgi:hypothetical protein